MYKVYRWVNDMPQAALTTCATLREAYDYAHGVAVRERKPAKAYRILGPLPVNIHNGPHGKSTSSESEPRHYWFVLNGVVPTHGAILASAVLQRAGGGEGNADEAPEQRESPQPRTQQTTQIAPAQTSASASQPSQKRFHVVRESPHERIAVGGEFMTRTEAQAYISMRREYEHDPAATYRVEVGPPDVGKNRTRRSTRSVRTAQERNVRRERIYREREGKGDLSLVARTDEELGLGIPAQWGKGRHSRKGEYIP